MATADLRSLVQPNEPIAVTASGTDSIDSFKINETRSVKWLVTISDLANELYQSSEVLAIHDGVNVLHNQYGIIGDNIPYEVDVVISGLDMILQVTNNGAGSIKVDSVSTNVNI